MAGFPQQYYGDQFQGNPSPAAGAPWDATASSAPQHPQSAPSSYRRPPPGRPRDHAGVLRDTVVSNWHRDISLFTRTHMPVLFLVPTSER